MDKIQTPFQSLLQRELTRKEFLVVLGLALLVVLKIEPIFRLFGKGHDSPLVAPSSHDPYGGNLKGIH